MSNCIIVLNKCTRDAQENELAYVYNIASP